MNKKIIGIFLLTILVTICPAYTQEGNKQSLDSKNTFKNELNINLLDFDFSRGFSSFRGSNILYKRKISPGKFVVKETMQVLRFMLNIGVQSFQEDEPYLELLREIDNLVSNVSRSSTPISRTSLGLSIGYERQKSKKNIITYWGGDLAVGYLKTRDNNFTFFNGEFRITNFPVDVNDINLEILGLSMRPFFGLKYFITNQLSISFEPTFNISYSFRSHMINEDVINALELDSNIDPVT